MQLAAPTPEAVYAKKAELSSRQASVRGRLSAKVTWPQIADAARSLGFSYPHNRYEKVVGDHDTSQPVLDAAWAALAQIEEEIRVAELELRAAGGDREAQDELDLMELAA